MRPLRLVLCSVILAALVAACGVRGNPEPPPGSQPKKDDPFVLDPVVE